MQRWVLHIDMDAFFASCEQLTRPTLQGRPVLVGGVSGRGVVAGASYEARAKGAHSAMPMFRAKQLVGPRGVVVTPRRVIYSTASKRVFEVIGQRVDLVEQLSIDEAFMEPAELVGATPEEVTEWAHRLRADIREQTGLPASIGAGTGKQYAKIGSGEAKPDGVFVMPAGRQLELLHPMDVAKLWGVGPVTEAKLKGMGVETIGDLAALSEKEVTISLGSTIGLSLWALARGVDDRPVAPRAVAKQISAEHTYPKDLMTVAEVDAAVTRAAKDAHRRLLKDGRGARTVTVKLRMADFHIESRSATLSYATDDAEILQATAFRLVRYPEELGPIRLVGVSYSGLEIARQDVLFPELDKEVVRPPAPDNDYETGVSDGGARGGNSGEGSAGDDAGGGVDAATGLQVSEASPGRWQPTQDVYHPRYGHGWVQGTGHGVVSVRFETRATGPGKALSLPADDPELEPADPLGSLGWDDWLGS
ncbi:DNA polymerase IV [Corynebacterium incognita]|uniref:DNA polymerase IV n=1 Tax=Corynebacterium incognita TaxID=2754725 RepID=A0A7G7CQH6_9CORY|nr:DNA polymerase IV [Corynebacterium incognita]QNE89842.1 DNA polymerase IV [Corynebacterium incognita]